MPPVTTTIDLARCTGCGACVAVCPAETLTLVDGHAQVTGEHCLACDHCRAVCPAEAVRVEALDPAATRLVTLDVDDRALAPGEPDPALVARLLGSRRSSRRFDPARPVPEPLLADLCRLAVTAPSGTNGQPWSFTVVPDRAGVVAVARAVGRFFHRLNRLADNPLARVASRLFGGDALGLYHRRYRPQVEDALTRFERDGRDLLFHHAPALIIVSTRPPASTPAEDALAATQNLCLAAHACGLGTCLIGFAVEAMRRDGRIGRLVGIPAEERVQAVIALGHSDERWVRIAWRKPFPLRWFRGPAGRA